MSQVNKIRSTARTPDYSGTTSSDWNAPSLGDYGYDSVENMSADEKSEVASHSLLGDTNADTFDELQFFPVVEPSSGNLNENALRAVISGRGSQADIPQDAKDSAQNKARNLLREEFDMGEEEEQAKKFISSLYKDLSVEDIDNEKFIGVSKSNLSKLVGNVYGLSKSEAKEMLDTLPEVKKHMEKEELKDTIKKVRDGEMEVEEALDKFVDVDKEVIDEIKEELDKEEPEKEPEEGESEKSEDTEKEEKTLEDKVSKIMQEENISKSKATVQVLDENPELYTKYKSRGG